MFLLAWPYRILLERFIRRGHFEVRKLLSVHPGDQNDEDEENIILMPSTILSKKKTSTTLIMESLPPPLKAHNDEGHDLYPFSDRQGTMRRQNGETGYSSIKPYGEWLTSTSGWMKRCVIDKGKLKHNHAYSVFQ